MAKYCPECKQNFSDSFDECVYCGAPLVNGTIEIIDDTEPEKTLSQLSNEEILDKYSNYRISIEKQVGKISDDDFINGLREGNRASLLHKSETSDESISKSVNIPRCPTCGNTDISRIATKDKVVSIALFGLLSNKRKKMFYCNNCKYEW